MVAIFTPLLCWLAHGYLAANERGPARLGCRARADRQLAAGGGRRGATERRGARRANRRRLRRQDARRARGAVRGPAAAAGASAAAWAVGPARPRPGRVQRPLARAR